MSFTIFDTGVLAFECCFSNLMSAAVNGLRAGLFFFALATLFLLKMRGLHSTCGQVSKQVAEQLPVST
jgi:hypothetical protein